MTNKDSKVLKTIALAITVMLLSVVYACRSSAPPSTTNTGEVTPPVKPTVESVFNVKESGVVERNSPFDHARPEHQTKTKDCGFCHQRPDNDVTPKFPVHAACKDCHTKDFFQTSSRMCISCHTDPVDNKGTLISFPKKMTEFGLKGFSHRDHMDPAKMKDQGAEVSCGTCHQFSDGVRASFPNHQQCYSCHAHQPTAAQGDAQKQADTQKQGDTKKLGECGVCHTDTKASLKFTKGSLPALGLYNFKHSSHTKAASCDRCHKSIDVPDNQARADIVEISTARGQRHNSACWSCHNQKREFTCTKCHRGSIPFSF